MYTLLYCLVDHALAIVNQLGKRALMAKIDLKNAFRLMPVHQEDWYLLGIHWKGKYFIDTFLPFGLRSAPYLFDQFATALQWILQHRFEVRHLLHYLNDFSTAGAPQSCKCSGNLAAMLSLCRYLNVPVKASKVEGPTTNLTFLGIVINTNTMQASISMEKKNGTDHGAAQDILSPQVHQAPTTVMVGNFHLLVKSYQLDASSSGT